MNAQVKNSGSNMYSNTKNTGKLAYNSVKTHASDALDNVRSAGPLKIFMWVCVIIIIFVIIWFLITYANDKASIADKENPIIISAPKYAFDRDLSKKGFKLPDTKNGLAFTYTFWMYISDWRYQFGYWKNIFLKGDINNKTRAPGMWLYPKTNSLHCRINTYADPNEGCDIKNIPLQKWVNVAYVLDNRTVDIYINGKLERSCVLRGIPKLNNNDLKIAADGKGFYGLLSKFQYHSSALTPSEVYAKYTEGPLTTPSYSMKFFQGGKFVTTTSSSGEYKDSGDSSDMY